MGIIVAENKHKGTLYPVDSKAIYRVIYEVVAVLPTDNIKTSVIYCLPIIGKDNEYDMYFYIDGWAKIGSGSIDLSDYYTKEEVDGIVSDISTLSFKIVQEKPIEDIDTNVIYLIPKSGSETGNIYEEWIYIDNKWELLGTTDIDLSNYMTLAPLNPTAAQIEVMPYGQLYGDTANHKGNIKGGQSFYDTEYIDENYRKIIINNTRRPPYRVANGSYVKPGDIWIYYDTVCILYSINYDRYSSGYICNWIPIHNQTSNVPALPSASGTLEIANYAEPSVSGRERAYPRYLTGDSISVGDTVYRVSLSINDSANRYTYTFTRIPSADDTYTKTEINSMIGDIETLLSEV